MSDPVTAPSPEEVRALMERLRERYGNPKPEKCPHCGGELVYQDTDEYSSWYKCASCRETTNYCSESDDPDVLALLAHTRAVEAAFKANCTQGFCNWCEAVFVGPTADAGLREHELTCPKNPLVRRLEEAEAKVGELNDACTKLAGQVNQSEDLYQQMKRERDEAVGRLSAVDSALDRAGVEPGDLAGRVGKVVESLKWRRLYQAQRDLWIHRADAAEAKAQQYREALEKLRAKYARNDWSGFFQIIDAALTPAPAGTAPAPDDREPLVKRIVLWLHKRADEFASMPKETTQGWASTLLHNTANAVAVRFRTAGPAPTPARTAKQSAPAPDLLNPADKPSGVLLAPSPAGGEGWVSVRNKLIANWFAHEAECRAMGGGLTADDLHGIIRDLDTALIDTAPSPAGASRGEGRVSVLERMRAAGWMVAVHNDYRLAGRRMTFWLFTHAATGRYAKGEGLDDAEAVQAAATEAQLPPPPAPSPGGEDKPTILTALDAAWKAGGNAWDEVEDVEGAIAEPWRAAPAERPAPPPGEGEKVARYFVRAESPWEDGTLYVRADAAGLWRVTTEGEELDAEKTAEDADAMVGLGIWREIPESEALSLIPKPAQARATPAPEGKPDIERLRADRDKLRAEFESYNVGDRPMSPPADLLRRLSAARDAVFEAEIAAAQTVPAPSSTDTPASPASAPPAPTPREASPAESEVKS